MAVALANGLGIASATAGNRVDQVGHRRAQAYLLRQATPGVAMPGILGASSPVAGYASQMKYAISPFGAVLTRTPDTGAVVLPNPNTFDIATTAAPTSNPRLDVIIVRQPLEDLSETGTAYVDVINGTPAASPAMPTLPAGALVLAVHRVNVGDTGTATAAGFTSLAADVSVQALITAQASLIADLTTRVVALEARNRVYTQAGEPAGAPDGSLWVVPAS